MKKDQRRYAERYRIDDGKKFRLKDWDPDECDSDLDKEKAAAILAEGLAELQDLQDRMYAEDRWSLLLIFQAMDAAGKDSTIKHVMAGVNPQGCEVSSFKQPSTEELDHDFLWRTAKRLPERGHIGIFNRSYYEEVLVVRVHPEFLGSQKLPQGLAGKNIWDERYEDINAHEKHLVRSGTTIRKFFLNVSRKEQKKRFLERLERPEKNWKFGLSDVKERERWDDYMDAYEAMIRATSTKRAPWFVIPADHKWYTRLVVAAAVVEALEEMRCDYPKVNAAQKRVLAAVRKELLKEKD